MPPRAHAIFTPVPGSRLLAAIGCALAAQLASACAGVPAAGPVSGSPRPPVEVGDASQVILVDLTGPGLFQASLTALEREGAGWKAVRGPVRAVIGRAGFAPDGEKREGDGRSPSGIFPLESAFGYAPHAQTGLPYRQATETDIWVDDASSAAYNTWTTLPTTASSYEVLRRNDHLYEYAVVIGYNTNPVVKGNGSAIFLHVWRGPEAPTAGCVALDRSDLVALLAWLDASRHPRVVMGMSPPPPRP